MDTSKLNVNEMRKNVENSSAFLKLLSNPTRLLILCNLIESERCVGDLEKDLNISQSALSQHLSKMRDKGIVKSEKQGQHVFYSISDSNVVDIINVLYKLFCKK
ncbi:MAG TPA: ArsR family transcriptional regulator [Candidatus Thioglobus sp.]|jgi:DNA-binding transcriptional ArsR family regulator|nr:metalloregulator ArsR/SmtB family transcription factor [Candidatus Thioglobus sp.]HIE77985.1 ArsR family transcriptional regulator [Candidatus Thioglobus sp.]HIL42461.1 ArsR family transcriptional regulator [Gammaproteobacteria bacterium]